MTKTTYRLIKHEFRGGGCSYDVMIGFDGGGDWLSATDDCCFSDIEDAKRFMDRMLVNEGTPAIKTTTLYEFVRASEQEKP